MYSGAAKDTTQQLREFFEFGESHYSSTPISL